MPFESLEKAVRRRLHDIAEPDATSQEREALCRLVVLLLGRGLPPELLATFPRQATLRRDCLDALEAGSPEDLEERLLDLYCDLHMNDAPYTPAERRRLDATGGYWNHAGGLLPLIKAGPFIHATTVLADYGAGNGLQGLLFQKLYPHRRTVQIEISSALVDIGCRLQAWLEIPRHRVDWIVADLTTIPPRGFDFIYLYRPVRPRGLGRRFYRRFATELNQLTSAVTLFSVADCLRPFLDDRFRATYSNGHLTCYTNDPSFVSDRS